MNSVLCSIQKNKTVKTNLSIYYVHNYIDIIFGHYISASAHTDCLNKLLKSVELGVLRFVQAAYNTQTNFKIK